MTEDDLSSVSLITVSALFTNSITFFQNKKNFKSQISDILVVAASDSSSVISENCAVPSTFEISTTLSSNRTVSKAVDLLESTKSTETMASGTTGPRTFESKVIYETTTTQEGTSMDETTVTNEKTTAGKEPF